MIKQRYPYALYLDSKILGTARQLVSFFDQGVFSAENTIIYLKKYKQYHKKFAAIFAAKNIPFAFMKPKELDVLEGQVIFYAFNAQSNCRVVANRKLKHIFITHGESNKVSSIKPIIRIYDHVVMAGRLSLERYYNSGLFDAHDYETGRLVMMGDTFIGKTGFDQSGQGTPALFYAPTWEGGLESENYSSLQNPLLVESVIIQALDQLKVNDLVIQPHPNLGHRSSLYLEKLLNLLKQLTKRGIQIHLHHNHVGFSLLQKMKLRLMNMNAVTSLSKFDAKHALIDISAMESQCINEKIPYHSFYRDAYLRQDIPTLYLERYQALGIELSQDQKEINIEATTHGIDHLSEALCDYSLQNMLTIPLGQRLERLGDVK